MTILTNSIDYVQGKLQQVDELLRTQVDPSRSPFEATLANLIISGGKRLRPRIALLFGIALDADPLPLLSLATAIEMLHTASIIHDDLVDGSLMRRGIETLNARWSMAVPVLIGDLAFTRAAKLVNNTQSFPVVEMFTHTMESMVEGEVTHLARVNRIPNQDEYFRWIDAKTASLFKLAAGAPVLLSPAGRGAFLAGCRFGHGIGMAFQIVDDVLDFTGDTNQLGKPVGIDLRQGIMTLPALIYFENHPEDRELDTLLHSKHPDELTLKGIIDRIRFSEAIGQSIETARGFIQEALEGLAYLPEGPEHIALQEIALGILEQEARTKEAINS